MTQGQLTADQERRLCRLIDRMWEVHIEIGQQQLAIDNLWSQILHIRSKAANELLGEPYWLRPY